MITQTVDTTFPPFTALLRRIGASDAAMFVAKESVKNLGRLQDSVTLGRRTVFEELQRVSEECETVGWDGESASPVIHATYVNAYRFIESLPLGIALPSAGAEADGHITLEWYRSARRVLSVSISPEGDLHWAALAGARKGAGTEPFFGEPPVEIIRRIRQVFA